jgi:hypothetical protein
MRFRLRTLLIVGAITPAVLAAVTVIVLSLLGIERPERPPSPMVPTTNNERLVLDLASAFVRAQAATDFSVPVKIVSSLDHDGCFVVEYWTPRREFQFAGSRAVIVDPQSRSAQFVRRVWE